MFWIQYPGIYIVNTKVDHQFYTAEHEIQFLSSGKLCYVTNGRAGILSSM